MCRFSQFRSDDLRIVGILDVDNTDFLKRGYYEMNTVKQQKVRGFTIVEALIVIAVFGVLLTLATPPLTAFLESTQARQDTNELLGSILLARSEAVTRNRSITMCIIEDGDEDDCDDDGGWVSGWLVFEDLDCDGERDSDEEIVYQFSGMKDTSSVTSNEFTESLTYLPSGAITTTGTLNVCAGSTARQITINATGRPRLSDASCPVVPEDD